MTPEEAAKVLDDFYAWAIRRRSMRRERHERPRRVADGKEGERYTRGRGPKNRTFIGPG